MSKTLQRAKNPLLKKVTGNIYVAQNIPIPTSTDKKILCFRPSDFVQYFPLCDDFGPMNMSSVVSFIEELSDAIVFNPGCQIIYFVDDGRRALTNALFLLGAYMIIKMHSSPKEVSDCFSWMNKAIVENYRDATYSVPDFHLTLIDCWRGLERGKQHGWIQLPSSTCQIWGKINIDEYDQYDDPRNGDLHEVVPGEFVAFKGPQELQEADYFDDEDGYRSFSPSYYFEIFRSMGVTAVVRLNEAHYHESEYTNSGISHHAMEFDDCTSPPAHIVDAFLRITDTTPGLVAVHCKAGLGRTGTLIALHMMRSHGFTAREAIAWLRIMRPGSVIGEQQHYLCAVDQSLYSRPAKIPAPPASYIATRVPNAPSPHLLPVPQPQLSPPPPGPCSASTPPAADDNEKATSAAPADLTPCAQRPAAADTLPTAPDSRRGGEKDSAAATASAAAASAAAADCQRKAANAAAAAAQVSAAIQRRGAARGQAAASAAAEMRHTRRVSVGQVALGNVTSDNAAFSALVC